MVERAEDIEAVVDTDNAIQRQNNTNLAQAVVDTANATASNLAKSVTPPRKDKRRVYLPTLNAFVRHQFLKEGDQMVFYLSEVKILKGELLLRKVHGATIKLKIQHLTELVDNDQARLNKILNAVKERARNLDVDEMVKHEFFTTSVTIFVQIAHELRREAAGSQPNQLKCITASNPYDDENLFVMPCKSAQGCGDRLVLMSTFREIFDTTVTEWRWRGRPMVSGDEVMSEPHIVGKAYGGEKKRKREGEAGGGGEKQSDGGGNGSVKGGKRRRRSRIDAWRGVYQLNVPARFQAQQTTSADDQHSGRASNEEDAQYRASQRTEVPERAGKHLTLTLKFDQAMADELCREFAPADEAKRGMHEGMQLHIPRNMFEKVLENDDNGCLVHRKENTRPFSFKTEFLQKCQGKEGIAHMICNPSGGGKYKCAYLDYSKMITEDTPHLRCVFVKKRELEEYRKRYPELLLVQLPPGSDALFVGDARFWILAFVTQLRLHAKKQESHVHEEFFSRCIMIDDDITVFHKIERGKEGHHKYTAVSLVDVLREKPPEKPPGPPGTAQLVGLIGYHCRSKHAPGESDWVDARDLATPVASVLNISTRVKVQFYMYAELAEDVDFDQRLRLAGYAVLKCNKYGYTRASSGNDAGASRAPDDSNGKCLKAVAKALYHAVAGGKSKHITCAGTYPYLRVNHPWALQSAFRPLGHYQFTFNRMCGLDHTKQIEHGLFIWIRPEDLPYTPAHLAECVEMFLARLRHSAVLVLPVGTVGTALPQCGRFQKWRAKVRPVFWLPWKKGATAAYEIIRLVARPPPPSGALVPSHAESPFSPPTSSSRPPGSLPSAVTRATAPAPASSHSQAPSPAPQLAAQSRMTVSAQPVASTTGSTAPDGARTTSALQATSKKRRQPQASTTGQRVASTAPDGAHTTTQEFWQKMYSENECPTLDTLPKWKTEQRRKAQKLKEDEKTKRLQEQAKKEFANAGGKILVEYLALFFKIEEFFNIEEPTKEQLLQQLNELLELVNNLRTLELEKRKDVVLKLEAQIQKQANDVEQPDPRRATQLKLCELLAAHLLADHTSKIKPTDPAKHKADPTSKIKLTVLAQHKDALDILFTFFEFRCAKKGGICAKQFADLLFKKGDDSLQAIFHGFINILKKGERLKEIFQHNIDNPRWDPFQVHDEECWKLIYNIIWQLRAREPNASGAGVAASSCQPTRAGEQDGARNETPERAPGGKRPAESTGQTSPPPTNSKARRELILPLHVHPAAQHSHKSVPTRAGEQQPTDGQMNETPTQVAHGKKQKQTRPRLLNGGPASLSSTPRLSIAWRPLCVHARVGAAEMVQASPVSAKPRKVVAPNTASRRAPRQRAACSA
ncbi:hypothetical protein AB1Y20_008514 [Prymnesium parvum]|uniref:TET-Associated Glycosyltransferase domain-containing protein n=1 Tax=Prymnesium parvum TaxID=97485 RepID=A0AB34IQI6_PRYPA